jgi:hypothetical protein
MMKRAYCEEKELGSDKSDCHQSDAAASQACGDDGSGHAADDQHLADWKLRPEYQRNLRQSRGAD